MKACISRKFFCLLLTVVMVCTLLPITALAAGPSGSIERAAITHHDNGGLKNAVSVDLKNVNFKSSVQVQLYSGETLLTTATLQGVNPGSYGFLTCCIATETADEYWSLTSWTPKDDVVPNKAVLVVDGHEQDTKTFTLDADEWAALPGTVLPCSIERAAITHANGGLKNAVSVDLKNVNFESSVQVQLYRGETLLTTATLQGVNPGSYGFLTCCIATETADEYWSLTSWTPKDDVVPNKAVLVVDGHEQDTKTFTLDADEWAALPGTVLPCSIERAAITHANGGLKNAVSVDLKNVNFESSVQVQLYRGETLLTTATLQGVNPGSYGFLTCCIATETADANWALTPWTPRDNVVPNKVVLFVDDNEMDTMEFTLDAAKWADLPGTVLPCSIERAAITHDNGVLKNAVSVDLKNVNFESSVQVQLYRGETLLTTATLQGVNPGSYGFLTCCIATETADEYWSLTSWTPKDDVVPNKAVLVVDGSKLDKETFTLNDEDWANLPGTAFPYSGSIERAAITHDNGVLKNAVSVDLKNVNFESSVQVQLYRGETLLTTATLQGVNPGSYGFLTCCIATETADANWALTPWTPKDDVVPNKVVLFVDDNKMDTMEFTLDAAEWKALPGTVLPYSGSSGGGHDNDDSDPTGNLSIELDVNGGDDEFTFTVILTDKDGDDLKNNFYYNGDYTGTIGSGDEITLEGGDKIVIRNLPEGTRYEVIIETADGYTYVIDGEEGVIHTGMNEAEFTATRTVPVADPTVTGVSRWLNVTDHMAYLSGYPGGAFGPDNNMTRAEVAQMFYALLNNKNVTITKTFPDVPADAWYAAAVNTLASLGMVSGDENGNYRPNDPITRAEFCVIALAFAYEPENAVCYFGDVSRSDWFYTYVAQAASYGWIGGYTNGNFGPNDRITRAQVTTIVNNMLGRAADRDYVIDHQADLVQFTDLTRAHWGYFQIMEATNAHDYTKSNGTENWR